MKLQSITNVTREPSSNEGYYGVQISVVSG